MSRALQIRTALVRPPASNFGDGLTTESLGPPSFERALEQHAAYCRALQHAGASIVLLEPDARYPDAAFVEDVAVVTVTMAVITRPGAAPRRPEAATVRKPLERFFGDLFEIVAPGTLDGGDVCAAGERFYVGISGRTNVAGAAQLADLLKQDGKECTVVDLTGAAGILHLKSGVSYLGDGRFAAVDALARRLDVPASRIVRVTGHEAYAANCVAMNGVVLMAAGHPRTQEALSNAGFATVPLEMSEFHKMDGGPSCLSLRF